jgi:hypothetical protein
MLQFNSACSITQDELCHIPSYPHLPLNLLGGTCPDAGWGRNGSLIFPATGNDWVGIRFNFLKGLIIDLSPIRFSWLMVNSRKFPFVARSRGKGAYARGALAFFSAFPHTAQTAGMVVIRPMIVRVAPTALR